MKSICDRISLFRSKKAESKESADVGEPDVTDYEIDESAVEEFDVSSMQKIKVTSRMAASIPTNLCAVHTQEKFKLPAPLLRSTAL